MSHAPRHQHTDKQPDGIENESTFIHLSQYFLKHGKNWTK